MDAAQVKKVTDNIEAAYQALRRAASALGALVTAGRATCDEVKAYNLWALATYNAQRGMLTTLRAAGEQNVPALPTSPTLFVWKGVAGADAWKIDCSTPVNGLSDAMSRALAGPQPNSIFLNANNIEIYTSDPEIFNPRAAPSIAALTPQSNGQLGFVWVIVIAAIAITVYVGIPALTAYLTENSIQEETTERMKTSATAYANYLTSRAACLADCLNRGGTQAACTTSCEKLIPRPDLTVDSARGPLGLGFWGTVGLAVVAVGGGAVAFKLYQRRRGGAAVPA